MIVMPSNHSSPLIHYWAGRYPNKLGWLVGPSAIAKTKLRPWLPFALDNDAYSAWSNKTTWSEDQWRIMLDTLHKAGASPSWAIVPDVVADKTATIALWAKYVEEVRQYGWPTAFAVQDGMTKADVPHDADVVFVGGSTEWKWATAAYWVDAYARVHIGRVNSLKKLLYCEKIGVESIDGTGWMRGTMEHSKKGRDLATWVEGRVTQQHRDQSDLFMHKVFTKLKQNGYLDTLSI
jgi:hypothetical protein